MSKDSSIPQIAKFLFNIYASDALEFEATANRRVADFLPELFPNSNTAEKERMMQMLKVQALTNFCHIAESLGATVLGFKTSYDDASSEIVGLYKTMSNYQVKQIINFYNEIKDRDNDYIAKIFGHPSLSVQEKQTRDLLELSCRNVRDDFTKIGDMYIDLEPMYNAYKHGYRLLLGKDDKDGSDTVLFIIKGGDENHISLTNDLLSNLRTLVYRCRMLLDSILENHRTRLEQEGADYNIFPTGNRVHIDKKGKKNVKQRLIVDASNKQTVPLKLLFPTRGQKLKEEKQIGNLIYESLKNKFQDDDQGKFVAIDIDNKKVVAQDFDIQTIVSTVHQLELTGRIYIRKIGTDSNTGIPIY